MLSFTQKPYAGPGHVNFEVDTMAKQPKSDHNIKKTVTITATCSRSEVRRLMQATTDELQYIDFSVTTRDLPALAASERNSLDGTKTVVITALCPGDEAGRLMEMASDTLGSVSFTVSRCVDRIV